MKTNFLTLAPNGTGKCTAKRRNGCRRKAASVPIFSAPHRGSAKERMLSQGSIRSERRRKFTHAPKLALADGRVLPAGRHPSGW